MSTAILKLNIIVSTICSRIIFDEIFDVYHDIYISFETITSIDSNNGLVIFVNDSQITDNITSIKQYLPGNGLGLLYPDNVNLQPTGHLISVAMDGIGNYGLSNLYAGTDNTGIDNPVKYSITTRANRGNIPFKHLHTSDSIEDINSNINTYRVRFKGFLNKVYVDILKDNRYYNIYNLDTNVQISDISRYGRVGFSYSGLTNFGIKNVTYSSNIINNNTL